MYTVILNSTYEKIGTVDVYGALKMYFLDKINIIESHDVEFRSESLTIKAPKLAILKKYVKVPYNKISRRPSRRMILLRDKHICQYCSIKLNYNTKNCEPTIDHVVPKSRGGELTWENAVASCKKCNVKKDNRLLKKQICDF